MTWFQDADNQTAATQSHAQIATFVDLDFSSGHVRVHTGSGTISWGGYDWLGVGKLGNVEMVKEDTELRPNALQLTLSGVDSSLITTAMAEDYHGRAVTVYLGFFNLTTGALVDTPETVFRGLMDFMTIQLTPNGGLIVVNCENELARWQRPRGLNNTHESQQLIYAGDRFFDLIPIIQGRTIDWSKKGTTFGNPVAALPRLFRGLT